MLNDMDEIRRLVNARIAETELGKNSKPVEPEIKITNKFIDECLGANELGDGVMFVAINRGKLIYNQTTGSWMEWDGHHWKEDFGNAGAMAAVDEVSAVYLGRAKSFVEEIANLEPGDERKQSLMKRQEKIYNRVKKLRSVLGANNCLKFATTCLDRIVTTSDQLDRDPWLIGFKNGVVDVRVGDLYPGRPDDLIYRACPHPWIDIFTECPAWDKALFEIMAGNQNMVDFLQRLLGYASTGKNVEHILPVFWGKGRNGKSLIVETLRHALGPLAAPIRAEMLLDQSFMKSSSGPNPDIMGLKGLRLAFANETDANSRLSSSAVKLLTGGDTLVGRNPHDKYETRFEPTHTLFLLTNNRPKAPPDDYALWKRLILIPFEVSFVENPTAENERLIDKDLPQKLKAEASGILAWLVRGCLRWQECGLSIPHEVLDATGDYRRAEDRLQDFLDERCETVQGYREKSGDLYVAFKEWYGENVTKRSIPTHKNFSTSMKLKFDSFKSNTTYFLGIRLLRG